MSLWKFLFKEKKKFVRWLIIYFDLLTNLYTMQLLYNFNLTLDIFQHLVFYRREFFLQKYNNLFTN